MSRKRDLSAEEAALWRRVVRDIVPKKPGLAPVVDVVPAPPRRIGAAVAEPPVKPAPKQARGPLADRGGEKRVRRGKLDIELKLDLHGYTQEKARAALAAFLVRAQGEGARLVLVVTGKGGRLRSGETAPGVLKQKLPEWLASPGLRAIVSGYAEAHQRHGGGGAYYVFVRAA